MKKMLAILMALLMAALLLPAYAEEGDVAEIAEIAGTVLEIGEESILLETPEGQLIEAILTADTIREGKEIAEGDFIHVRYNGQMTRSIPAQVTADTVDVAVTIDELAARFYISKYHMMRRFRQETGYSIHGYLTEKRLLLAQRLLAQGASPSAAGEQAGYQDYSTFSRAYKKQFGHGPSADVGQQHDLP